MATKPPQRRRAVRRSLDSEKERTVREEQTGTGGLLRSALKRKGLGKRVRVGW